MEAEMMGEIKAYLTDSQHPHLADCLDTVPEEHLEALYNLISDHEANKTQRKVISMQVAEDVSAITAGFPEGANFSKEYL